MMFSDVMNALARRGGGGLGVCSSVMALVRILAVTSLQIRIYVLETWMYSTLLISESRSQVKRHSPCQTNGSVHLNFSAFELADKLGN